jgi:6-pyruvoyltetrahydropterin/6-carboxytetrahydropterin synthase
MSYEIKVEGTFAAAHALRGYGGECERLHGHNFNELSSYLGDVLEQLDHRNLNELPAFEERNPTAENIAAYIFEQLAPRLENTGAALRRVTVEESSKYAASFIADD